MVHMASASDAFKCSPGIIFCDYDGTLTTSTYAITDDLIESFKALRRNGYMVAVITGSSFVLRHKIYDSLKGEVDFICTSNGLEVTSYVKQLGLGLINLTHIADKPAVVEFLKQVKKAIPGIQYGCRFHEGDESLIVLECEELLEARLQKLASISSATSVEKVRKTCSVSERPELYISKGVLLTIMLFSPQDVDPKTRERVEKLANEYLGEDTFVESEGFTDNLGVRKGSKAAAARWLLDLVGLTLDDSMAFGDGDNDISMLSYVEKSFVVGDESKLLMNHPRVLYQTPKTDNGGIVPVLQSLLSSSTNIKEFTIDDTFLKREKD